MPDTFDQDGKWKFAFIPEFADCIARIASLWARLEYDINRCIWSLADVKPALGACVTSQIVSLHARLSSLLALARLRRVEQRIIDDINRFAEQVRGAQDKRNRTVHDLWLQNRLDPATMGRLRITADKKLNFSIQAVALPELMGDLQNLENRVKEFAAIRQAIEAALSTLPEIPHIELHPIVESP